MAYTAPTDLFTSEEAILSLASSIADEDRTNLGNGTINGALDVLADALADQNVEVPPMNSGAILALAQYVTGGGGGGSSDFTTAQVTIVNGTSSPITVTMVVTVDSIEEGSYLMPFVEVDKNGTSTLSAVLYKGHGTAIFSSGTISIEGSATDLGGGAVDVTGDCTITVS